MDLLPMYYFVTFYIALLENIRSLSYADLTNLLYNIKISNLLISPVSSEKFLCVEKLSSSWW